MQETKGHFQPRGGHVRNHLDRPAPRELARDCTGRQFKSCAAAPQPPSSLWCALASRKRLRHSFCARNNAGDDSRSGLASSVARPRQRPDSRRGQQARAAKWAVRAALEEGADCRSSTLNGAAPRQRPCRPETATRPAISDVLPSVAFECPLCAEIVQTQVAAAAIRQSSDLAPFGVFAGSRSAEENRT